MEDIAKNLEKVRKTMEESARKVGRDPKEITLIAVTKRVDVDRIKVAVDHGVRDIGENRVQELLEKYDALKAYEPSLRFHLIGRLQTNKVKYIVDKVCLIHSVDSLRLLQEIEKQSAKIGKVMEVLLEVNLSGEEQKGGFDPGELENVLVNMHQFPHVLVRGFMTVPPVADSLSKNSRYFSQLRQLFIDMSDKKYDNTNMGLLSMGMSNDFDIAIENGAHMVRVGSAIFGKRI